MHMQILGTGTEMDFSWDFRGEIHLAALDAFGAVVCRRCVELDPDSFADPRVRCEWLGAGEAPDGVAWQPLRTSWHWTDSSLPEHATANRTAAASFLAAERIDGALEQDHLILIGSLFQRSSVDRALALLDACFQRPALRHIWRLCAFWAASEEAVAYEGQFPASDQAAHAAVAELSKALNAGKGEAPRLAPQFVVGRSPDAVEVLTGWEDSVAIAAAGVLARLYEVHARRQDERQGTLAEDARHSVFSFDYLPAGDAARIGDARESWQHPFALLGGYVISNRMPVICGAAAALFAAQSCHWLAEQPKPSADMGPALEEGDTAFGDALQKAEGMLWNSFSHKLEAAGLSKTTHAGELPERLRQAAGWPKLFAKWKQHFTQAMAWDGSASDAGIASHECVMPHSGLGQRPLEEWDQHLQEWEAITEFFFDDCRRSYQDDFVPTVLRALDQALHETVEGILSDSFLRHDSSRLLPNILARRLVHSVHTRLGQWQMHEETLKQEELRESRFDEARLQAAPGEISDKLTAVKRGIRTVPSRSAAAVSGILLAGLLMLLPILLPALFESLYQFAIKVFGSSLVTLKMMILSFTAAFAVIVPCYVVWRSFGRRQLQRSVKAWTDAVVEYQDLRLRRASWELRTMVYRVSLGYTRWLKGSGPASSRRSLGEALTESGMACEFLSGDERFSSCHPLLAWLHDFPQLFREKKTALRQWADTHLASQAKAPRVLNLPAFPDNGSLDALEAWLLTKGWQPGEATMRQDAWLEWWRNLLTQLQPPAAPWLRRNDNNDWLGCPNDPLIPAEERIPAAQANSAVLQFAGSLTAHAPWQVSLDALLLDQIIDPATRLLQDKARAAIAVRCLPPSPGGHAARLRILSAPGNPMSRGLGQPNEAHYAVPGLPFAAVVSVLANVPVETIQRGFDSEVPAPEGDSPPTSPDRS